MTWNPKDKPKDFLQVRSMHFFFVGEKKIGPDIKNSYHTIYSILISHIIWYIVTINETILAHYY